MATPPSSPLWGIRQTLGPSLFESIITSRILVVGAGGIGCELLKNLALCGFRDVEVIDLDTIDVSNLNRQFLFRSKHVGMAKCTVACEVAAGMAPEALVEDIGDSSSTKVKFVPRHGDVTSSKFSAKYLSSFALVFNALDNVPARRHVNRLCLAAKVPLIEAGTTGYLGQVTVIHGPSGTECYECQGKQTPKVYPICTIRSTPSRPVHCIVWAKELYKLIFGGKVEDSMLYEDPNLGKEGDEEGGGEKAGEDEGNEKASGEKGAEEEDDGGPSTYMHLVQELRSLLGKGGGSGDGDSPAPSPSTDASALRSKTSELLTALYDAEIRKQIEMKRYEGAAKVPVPLKPGDIAEACGEGVTSPSKRAGSRHTDVWNTRDCAAELTQCILDAASAFATNDGSTTEGPIPPEFDKDHPLPMSFVCASSNLRSTVFSIDPLQSYYSAKGIAGNIIPAIATTNAVVAGLQVLQAFHILRWRMDNTDPETGEADPSGDKGGNLKERCKYIYCNREKTRKGYYLQPTRLPDPNPQCYVCRSAVLDLSLHTSSWTLEMLLRRILKKELNFIHPTVMLGTGDLIYEEGDELDAEEVAVYAKNLPKKLSDLPGGGVKDGSSMRVEDFGQDLEVELRFVHREDWEGDTEEEGAPPKDEEEQFRIGGKRPKGKEHAPSADEEKKEEAENSEKAAVANPGAAANAKPVAEDESDSDDLEIMEPSAKDDGSRLPQAPSSPGRRAKKRKGSDVDDGEGAAEKKRIRAEDDGKGGDDDVVVIELD